MARPVLRCNSCSQKAAIYMRQHKLALCKQHFPPWIQAQTQRFIEKYGFFAPQDKILVAVSGGKDSLALWDILNELGYQADGLYIDLGIAGDCDYSQESRQHCQDFTQRRDLHLQVVDLQAEAGHKLPEITRQTARSREKPCSVCGLIKRHSMNRAAREGGYNVLATGHNLDDEAATLLGNTLNWQAGYLRRQGPVLPASHPGLVRKVKPLFRFYEREMAAYALLRGIDYIQDECPYAQGARSIYYKQLLNQLEAGQPGAKLSFYLSYLKAKEAGLFTPEAGPGLAQLSACPQCGQPSSLPELCSFCRLMGKLAP